MTNLPAIRTLALGGLGILATAWSSEGGVAVDVGAARRGNIPLCCLFVFGSLLPSGLVLFQLGQGLLDSVQKLALAHVGSRSEKALAFFSAERLVLDRQSVQCP